MSGQRRRYQPAHGSRRNPAPLSLPLVPPEAPPPPPSPPPQNTPTKNHNFPRNSYPTTTTTSRRPSKLKEAIERIDQAVIKARRDLLATGQNVSAWKVCKDALLILQAESWDSLGFRMQQIPSLFSLILIESNINAFIHCFVAVRRITSLYDLEVAICENEGIELFEELELGPLVRHPLVVHYFSVSSDMTEVFRITSEDIISGLWEFMDTNRGEEVVVNELLDFIAKKRTVTSREMLIVRIQSLGTHIARMKKARLSENTVTGRCLKGLKKRHCKPRDFCGSHMRFISSGSDDDDRDTYENEDYKDAKDVQNHCNFSAQNINSSDQVNSCTSHSAADGVTHVGLNSDMDGRSSPAKPTKRERKLKKLSCTISAPHKLHKNDTIGSDLFSNSTRKFITDWKDACQERTVAEVFERMALLYTKKKKNQMKHLFSSHPCLGLLHVAVTSIKCGMWDNMYDAVQTFREPGGVNTISEKHIDNISIEVEPTKKDALLITEQSLKCKDGFTAVTVEDIINKVWIYFEPCHDIMGDIDLPLEKKFINLKKLCKCEFWLTDQFNVKEFESLGYGEFFKFLKKHVCQLPHVLQKCLAADKSEKLSLEACMLQDQLCALLSQASNSLWGKDNINKQKISELLMRQFPSICFKLVESGSLIDFRDIVREKEINVVSNCVLFSAALLGTGYPRDSSAHSAKKLSEAAGIGTDIDHNEGILGFVTTKDAIEVLLKAPMLTDLYSWSHWDLIFAPSLGPLVQWLLTEVNTKELLCLVTKGGQVMRIDQSATVDSFFEVFLQGSSFQIAVKLLSLFSLYGGEQNVPLSLLKCRVQQAFEVIVKNVMEMEVNDGQNLVIHGKPLCTEHLLDEHRSGNLRSELHKNSCGVNKAVPAASRVILDCLSYLPMEFRSFAAEVLLSGLGSVVKDAHSAILSECKQVEQRLMLHDVGLSLGIVQWINDYHSFSTYETADLIPFGPSSSKPASSEFSTSTCAQVALDKFPSFEAGTRIAVDVDLHNVECKGVHQMDNNAEISGGSFGDHHTHNLSPLDRNNDPDIFIESIRREEFGLDPSLSVMESIMLKKQHARLGRALHCLSQELYSQDSHFLLELVQNADDNVYPGNVAPTLTFILQKGGIIVLNNEQGFSAENIRALCDVGNSTKKGSTGGYIGKKGIGFKSVFRVTDAPEIHSNGFHIKFDISEGQIGFVLPTVIPPCDIDFFSRLISADSDQMETNCWNTCIVIPFRSKLSKGFSMNSIESMFSDLHPSLLLFLHRLQCIKFRNLLNDSLIVMRKEVVGDGIIKVSHGMEQMTWFVVSQKLRADVIRADVLTTEISIAFTLQGSDIGDYIPHLDQQPVFAFLPLRTYGLKFILQGDFILPSSREEVDGDSPWNQWLLSEFPGLFVSAERSFCDLPCFRFNPGKAISAFMSFVPLVGEVHGFFSSLPRMIISRLRMSNCLLIEGDNNEWVPPCMVLRSWTEQARALLSDSLLREHLGLGFLGKDIVLSDSLARALGIEEYGPKILIQIISSLCRTENGLKSRGLIWLSSWLNSIYLMSFHTSGKISLSFGTESDLMVNLKKIPFIPLSDGTYASVDKGAIWLPSDDSSTEPNNECGPKAFPNLFADLRTVSPALFSASAAVDFSCFDASTVENITRMLYRVGVQRLSAHEILKLHILPALSGVRNTTGDKDLMTEYLSFVMFHLQSSCSNCGVEREHIISELYNRALILTNHGYRRPAEVSIHFNKEFGNPIDVHKLINGINVKWHEVDITYLKHPITKSFPDGMWKWRRFLQELGITDFVQVVQLEKNVADISNFHLNNMMWDRDMIVPGSLAKDWESKELVHLLSQLSTSGDRTKCKYLLEILDTLWDDCFSDKVTGYCYFNSIGESTPFTSTLLSILHDFRGIVSSMDDELHYPTDLFHDCEAVHSILGGTAPYAVPKVKSEKLVKDIRFKNQVTLHDILSVLQVWRRSETPFMASITQMSTFYAFLWNEMSSSKQKIVEVLCSGAFIYVPHLSGSRNEDVVPGVFLSPQEVYWHDSTGSMDQIKTIHAQHGPDWIHGSFSKMLCHIYPGLHDFFVNECGVGEAPPPCCYLQVLLQLSTVASPLQAAKTVFQVFLKWSEGFKFGLLSSEDAEYLKEGLLKMESTVLPTAQDKWVSLHASFGLVCWCDDEKLKEEFTYFDNIEFLYFGELSDEEKEMLQAKFSDLMRSLGIPALSEIVTREAIYYGPADSDFKASLVNWVLPYAQRYIYNAHPGRYFQLKQSEFENLSRLRIVVVEKLFYRNVIKRSNIASKKRSECSCLLQDNILYTTQESDSHSIFMELARLFIDGGAGLHLANFLHMITTMAETGSTKEQTEVFILNSQKVPKLPIDESVWSLSSALSSIENDEILTTTCVSTTKDDPNPTKSMRKPRIKSNWPPSDWKTAPSFSFAYAHRLKTQAGGIGQMGKGDDSKAVVSQTEHIPLIKTDVDWIEEDDLEATPPAVTLQDSEIAPNDCEHENDIVAPDMHVVFDSLDLVTASDGLNADLSNNSSERDQLSFGTTNEKQALLTGRLGELVAFKYFVGKVGEGIVKWVNEACETGLPYDIVVGEEEKDREYIEVKSTKSASKDWSIISVKEWQFAVEKGESFSIVHVVLLGSSNVARITIYKNPARLCQLGKLQLAVVIPKQPKGIYIDYQY